MKEDWLLIQKQGVLIVAKCNVNIIATILFEEGSRVLIVAKCNVNQTDGLMTNDGIDVLIVAKCNVNIGNRNFKVGYEKY